LAGWKNNRKKVLRGISAYATLPAAKEVRTVKCPKCKKEIDDRLIARHLASKGGRARVNPYRPSPEKAREMARLSHESRANKKQKGEVE
jgi:hypothetical protein